MGESGCTIGVLVADDHPAVRAGLVSLLTTADDIEIVATACDGAEAVALAAEHHPDVVLMDLSMPNVCGAEATRAIVASDCDARVLILTVFSDRAHLGAALDAGAVGYLLKDAEPKALIGAVRAAATG
jgi:DNA-binding NarL/FixJ family response regulator